MTRRTDRLAELRRLAAAPSIDAIAEPLRGPRVPDDGRARETAGGWWSWMWDARGERRILVCIPKD